MTLIPARCASEGDPGAADCRREGSRRIGDCSPPSIDSNVDLPAPFSPISDVTSPEVTDRLTRRARRRPEMPRHATELECGHSSLSPQGGRVGPPCAMSGSENLLVVVFRRSSHPYECLRWNRRAVLQVSAIRVAAVSPCFLEFANKLPQ
jgi:hypothetical protein